MRRNLKDRKNRIIARGETSNHSHIITGECEIEEKNGEVIITAGKNCAIKHLIESVFVETGVEQWTQEHTDIQLTEGEQYKYVQQIEYNPYEKAIQNVRD
jgi:hypothetical protein